MLKIIPLISFDILEYPHHNQIIAGYISSYVESHVCRQAMVLLGEVVCLDIGEVAAFGEVAVRFPTVFYYL